MNQVFKSLTTRQDIDLVPYIKDYLSNNRNAKIYIGCDSQNAGSRTLYATVVVLYTPTKGGHVLFCKEEIVRHKFVKQNSKTEIEFQRLWAEVEKSLAVAEHLKEAGIKKPEFIDVDINPDPRYKSNTMLRSALGYVESLGYAVRCKPYAFAASYAADNLCH